MDRYDEDAALALPAEVDDLLQQTVGRMLEPCSCQDHWEVKFAEAVDSQRQLQEQVYVLLRRLEEADLRCSKSRVCLSSVFIFQGAISVANLV